MSGVICLYTMPWKILDEIQPRDQLSSSFFPASLLFPFLSPHPELHLCVVFTFIWEGYFSNHSFTRYWSFWALLFGQSLPCMLKLILVRMQRLFRGCTGRTLSLMLRKIWEGWFWLSSRKECICIRVRYTGLFIKIHVAVSKHGGMVIDPSYVIKLLVSG